MLKLKYALEYIRRNKALSIATIIVLTITFILINIFLSAQIITDRIAAYLNKQQKISILYDPDAKKEEIMTLKKELEKYPSVRRVIYKDSATLQRETLKSLGLSEDQIEEFLQNQENAIKILQIELKPNQPYQDILNRIDKEQKRGIPIVSVVYFKKLIDRIRTISKGIKIAGGIISGGLIVISLQLIYMTISFSVTKLKDEIKTMYLVGAPKSTITQPFAIQGGIYGALSALAAFAVLTSTALLLKLLLADNYFIKSLHNLLTVLEIPQLINNRAITTAILAEGILGFIIGYVFGNMAVNNTIKKLNYD